MLANSFRKSPANTPEPVAADTWKPAQGPLMSRWAGDVTPDKVLPEYPRPQMVRERWENLNGLWDHAVSDKSAETVPTVFSGKILVPYPIESALSGVMKPLKPDQRLWYRRAFTVPPQWKDRRVLLHFGAVDWQATVFLNGASWAGIAAVTTASRSTSRTL